MSDEEACAKKVTHESRAVARHVIRKMRGRDHRLHAYRRPVCGFWHVGGSGSAERRAALRERAA